MSATTIERLDGVIAALRELRGERERAEKSARPEREDPLVRIILSGDLPRLQAELASARAANAALAREVETLRRDAKIGAELQRQLDGGGLTTGERLQLAADLAGLLAKMGGGE